MNLLAVRLALSLVLLIFLLLTLRRTPAGTAGVAGWIRTILVTWSYFQTAPWVVSGASLAGIVASLPIAISPVKLQNASVRIDRSGEEAQVMHRTFVVALAITAVCAVMTLLCAF
jgi:L-lactate permease